MDDSRAALPPGWIQVTDPKTGRVYNANPTTKETRWDRTPLIGSGRSGAGGSLPSPDTSSRGQSNPSDSSANLRALPDNQLFSAATTDEYNPAYGKAHKLVAMTRDMLDKAMAFPEESIGSNLELHSITPGQIADLCHLQQKQNWSMGEEGQAYTPLNPYTMPTTSQVQETEPARLEARLRSLKNKLEIFETKNESGNKKYY